jgi:hypothetical protein
MTDETPKSAASAAAEQVQAIVAAAEQSAAALEAAAREDAERIRSEADRDSSRARDVAARLSERADELERRLDELVSGVREAVEGLRTDLADLRRRPSAAASEQRSDDLDDEVIAEVEAVAAKPPDVKVSEEPDESPGERAIHPEGARVIAVKMALDGSPREVTARYLNENFELADPDGLLDEVYARMGQ